MQQSAQVALGAGLLHHIPGNERIAHFMIPRNFPGRGKVAVLKTQPETVLSDIGEVMHLAGYQDALPRDAETLLKINISWQTWYPACSTTPWQLEGVIRTLHADGYEKLIGAQNNTVVVDAYVGERNNKHKYVVDKYDVENVHLYEPHVEWVRYQPKSPFLVLDQIFPDGVKIPKMFIGRNIIQLPTVKTHVFTTITGAMKNAFGGLLSERRHWTHSVIDETLVDLLQIQQDIHTGLFAVMDGTFAGDGAGPRAMRPHEKDILLGSADQVAIDAISAKLQGFNPMDLPFIRIAHEQGLGVGEPKDIEIAGYDISLEDWKFVKEDTFASMGQHLIYHGPFKRFERALLQSPLVPWSLFASNFYHNVYWYPVVGRKRVKQALTTRWGELFTSYGDGRVVLPGPEPGPTAIAAAGAAGMVAATALAVRAARRG
ncbi:MAG: DUF362 domain-containing protein [Chloroflexota bacterium]|nr:DUF362 domain-containing protein [Chloroflexota bacterium]